MSQAPSTTSILSRTGRAIGALLSVAILVGGAALGSGSAVARPTSPAPPPASDPFYTHNGSLNGSAPGAVLRTRPATFGAPGLPTPIVTTQVLYRTTDQRGDAVTTVATILRPLVPGPTKLISYHMAYDALGSQCDPSYTLRGYDDTGVSRAEQVVIAGYVAAGYTVVVPDYEGQNLEWTIGRQSAYAALDGVRAAERVLRLPNSTPVGLVGYSGGSVPTQWGAEVAPTYAPELNIVAAAAGGLPVFLAHNLPYISGGTQWAGIIPALVVAYQRTYRLDTGSFLSRRGMQVIDQVDSKCIGSFAARYPGLTDRDMVRAPYRSLLDSREVVAAINDNIMGSAGTPRTPMLLAVGHSDRIGDSLMVTRDVEGLAHKYCAQGVPVTYAQYEGRDHGAAFAPFEVQAADFLAKRFAGVRAASTCAATGVGNALTPLPLPPG